MKTIYIISIILIIIIFFLHTKKKEHLLASNEAVNNIAKIYADVSGTVAFNNIKTTGNLDVSGVARFNKITGVDISGIDISGGNLDVYGFANFRGASNNNPNNLKTQFPNSDGKNYIRGHTLIDGVTEFTNSGLPFLLIPFYRILPVVLMKHIILCQTKYLQ